MSDNAVVEAVRSAMFSNAYRSGDDNLPPRNKAKPRRQCEQVATSRKTISRYVESWPWGQRGRRRLVTDGDTTLASSIAYHTILHNGTGVRLARPGSEQWLAYRPERWVD